MRAAFGLLGASAGDVFFPSDRTALEAGAVAGPAGRAAVGLSRAVGALNDAGAEFRPAGDIARDVGRGIVELPGAALNAVLPELDLSGIIVAVVAAAALLALAVASGGLL